MLLLTSGSATALDAPTDDLPRLQVAISSVLQDLVMDDRNGVWPVVRTVDGGFAVAEPVFTEGRACWVEHGGVVADIGRLGDVIERHD